MIKAMGACAVVLLAAGCTWNAAPASPQDSTIKELVARLAPAISCHAPQERGTAVLVNCDSGRAFVMAYEDAEGMREDLERFGDAGVGEDYLVGETWFAGANDLDGLARMRARLGGRVQHVGPQPSTG